MTSTLQLLIQFLTILSVIIIVGYSVIVVNNHPSTLIEPRDQNFMTTPNYSLSMKRDNPSLHAVRFPSKVQNLSHVVVDSGSHHFFSAYYDSRTSLPYRPAVVLLGYVKRHTKVFFAFRYEDNTTKCFPNKVVQTSLIAPNVAPEMYLCQFKPESGRIPVSVMLSSNSKCDMTTFSNPIPVRNREQDTPQEDVGVCVHGPLYNLKTNQFDFFQLIVEFLAMVKTLGAKIVTMYSNNLDHEMLEEVLKLYPGFVDIVQWIDLNNTLHYYGQRILLNDCMYRNMYRVNYLTMFDIDEMIFPVRRNHWPSMIKSLPGDYASYTFSNNFMQMEPDNASPAEDRKLCDGLRLPKYFTRLTRLPWPSDKRRTKMKMIVKPKLISSSCIHDICGRTVRGTRKTYWVPMSTGVMAHYRVPIDRWYVFGKGVVDKTALKYKEAVVTHLKEKCNNIIIAR